MTRRSNQGKKRASSSAVSRSAKTSASPTLSQEAVSVTQEFTVSAFSGPIPPADVLARYEAVCPGAADRIIGMAERQSRHRQEMERAALVIESDASKRGTHCGLAACLAALAVAALLGYWDQPWAAGSVVVVDIVGLVGVFVYGNRSRRQERIEKTRIMTSRKGEDTSKK